MNLRRISFEHILYLSALALGIFVRLANLGRAPLSDFEASWALQAWQVVQNAAQATALGPNPAYIFITALLFNVFGSSESLARLAPALAGSLLVILPWFFRRQLGRNAAVVLAFGLALDPGLVSQSRLAGSGMLAFTTLLFALAMLFQRQWTAFGVLAALALLSGPAAIFGIVLLALTALVVFALPGTLDLRKELFPLPDAASVRRAGLAFAGAALLAGTFLFLQPSGLSAWFNAIPAYLSGWTADAPQPAIKLIFLLVTYQPLACVFGLIGLGRSLYNRQGRGVLLGVWLLIATLLVLIYPARQSGDLVWLLLPLWVLAAGELGEGLTLRDEPSGIAYTQAAVILVLIGLFWLNLAGMANSLLDTQASYLRLAVMSGVFILGGLTTVLVGMGWSKNLARWGATMGLVAGLGIYTLAGLSSAALLRSDERWSAWAPVAGPGDAGLFMQTIEQLAVWRSGNRQSLDVLVAVDSPALRWLLRDYPQVQFAGVAAASVENPASVVITRQSEDAPSLASSYRGQDFVWWSYSEWQANAPPDVLRWLAYRTQPWWHEKIILWARADLFPGEASQSTELIVPEEFQDEQLAPVPPEELQE
jgi:hypothetical protein